MLNRFRGILLFLIVGTLSLSIVLYRDPESLDKFVRPSYKEILFKEGESIEQLFVVQSNDRFDIVVNFENLVVDADLLKTLTGDPLREVKTLRPDLTYLLTRGGNPVEIRKEDCWWSSGYCLGSFVGEPGQEYRLAVTVKSTPREQQHLRPFIEVQLDSLAHESYYAKRMLLFGSAVLILFFEVLIFSLSLVSYWLQRRRLVG